MATVPRKRRAQAKVELDAAGAPDPFEWLVRRWVAMSGVTRKNAHLTGMDDRMMHAEALAKELVRYTRPRLKAVDQTVINELKIEAVIRGNS